jgi:oligosaccharide amylase
MYVYLPTAAIGNGRVLATLGGAGEIMTFFYPRIDFAQNVREALPALYVNDPGHGYLLWTFDAAFRKSQTYLPHGNVVRTTLELPAPSLTLELEDFCPPATTALCRGVRVRNTGTAPFRGAFLHYFDLRLGEVPGKQAVRWDAAEGYMLQYFRDIVLAVGGTLPDMWRCGRSLDPDGPQSAKQDMLDGHLNGQPEDIGQVDFALGYRLELAPGAERQIDLFLGAEVNHYRTSLQMKELLRRGPAALRTAAEDADRQFLARATQLPAKQIGAELEAAAERALLSLRLLLEEDSGAVIAAPEFDGDYERSGGYGYCWPRDASEAAAALTRAGYPEYEERLADWYVRHQFPGGYWGQRYWTEGMLAASWALREDFLQLDQCGAAVLTLCAADRAETTAHRRAGLWAAVQSGAGALADRLEAGWHSQACDLWETYCGKFVYTNAAVAAALRAAAEGAERRGMSDLAAHWTTLAGEMRAAVLGLYTGDYFPRGLRLDGHVDYSVDTATLGLVAPFGLLDLADPQDREKADSNLRTIRARLSREVDGQVGLRRYEGDAYLGGSIGCVNTLWAALVALMLARAWAKDDPKRSAEHQRQGRADVQFCLAHATPTGLLPEIIVLDPGTPYWAAPHAWASALLLDCVRELRTL